MSLVCPRCGGMIKEGQIKVLLNDKTYHYYCSTKEQERLKEERAKQREDLHKAIVARNQFDFDDYQ